MKKVKKEPITIDKSEDTPIVQELVIEKKETMKIEEEDFFSGLMRSQTQVPKNPFYRTGTNLG